MKTVEELKKLYAAKISEADAKTKGIEGRLSTQEERDAITAIFGEADQIKAELQMAERLADGNAYLDEPAGTKAAHLGFRPSGPGEGDADIDVKSFREFEVKIGNPSELMVKTFRYHVPLVVQRKGYADAFESYLRKGRHDMGPNDRKALVEAADASGGYLVPEDLQASIIKKVATFAVVRQFARVITTSRDIVKWPRVKYTTDNKYTSAVRLTWTGETPTSATVHRVTDQVFGEFNIPIGTAMASQLVSADLIQDAAFDVLGISSDLFAEAFALGEEDRFWNGNGAGQPRGILTDASDTTNFDAQVQTGAAANAIDADEVIDVCYAVPTQYERNCRWFFTKATEKYIRKLKNADSDYLWPIILQSGNFGAAPRELLGMPTTRTEFIDNISDGTNTTTYPLVCGDMNAYAIVDRVGLSVQRYDEIYSETNQVLLLGKKRVGGQLIEAYRLSLLKTVNST